MSTTSKPPINSVENLTHALKEAGVPFELENGNVKATPAVVAYLNSKEALGDPDNPVSLTEDEVRFGRADEQLSDEEKGYSFKQYGSREDVEGALETGELGAGPSELEAASSDHRCVEIYQGPIAELQGKAAIIKRNPNEEGVAAQFDDATLTLNGRALGFGWHDFPIDHFSDTRPFFFKWKDMPSHLRAHMRKAHNIPRLHGREKRFQTKGETRRGTKGAFGGQGARRVRVDKLRRQSQKRFLLNVLTDGEDKTLAVEAANFEQAKRAARVKHAAEFPNETIINIERHEEV